MSKGWHGDWLRHSNARMFGKAGPPYRTKTTRNKWVIKRRVVRKKANIKVKTHLLDFGGGIETEETFEKPESE